MDSYGQLEDTDAARGPAKTQQKCKNCPLIPSDHDNSTATVMSLLDGHQVSRMHRNKNTKIMLPASFVTFGFPFLPESSLCCSMVSLCKSEPLKPTTRETHKQHKHALMESFWHCTLQGFLTQMSHPTSKVL